MTETVGTPEDAAAARAAEQARLRKERREAKIKAGGAARLNKITGLGGGVQRDPQPQPPPSQTSSTTIPTATPQANVSAKSGGDDPEEVDISQHYYAPRTTTRAPVDPSSLSEAQLRQMMLGFDTPPGAGTPPSRNPFLEGSGMGPGALAGGMPPMPSMPGGMENDPVMKMLQQMMGGGAGPGSVPNNPFAGTGMEGLFGAGAGGTMPQKPQQVVADKSANIWRIVHAIFALGLGLYVALSTTFTGTKAERDSYSIASSSDDSTVDTIEKTRAYFFYLFTSVEAVLLTSRFFLDKKRSPPSGILWTVAGFLPNPIGGELRHVLQYGQILSTVRNDALVCVFVLGVCCWLRS